jgi:hypothetical protein
MFLKRENGHVNKTLDDTKIVQSMVKYDLIVQETWKIWEITFFSWSTANQTISNTFMSQKDFLT